MKILIAIPCFNEELDIEKCIHNLNEIKNTLNKNYEVEIAIFDDGSTDKTSSIINSLKDLTYIKTKQNYGLARVFNNIIFYCKTLKLDYLILFDADNQYPYKEIPDILQFAAKNKGDITLGVRDFKKINIFSKFKSFLQTFGSFVISFFLGIKIYDVTTGFRIYSSKALENLYVTNNFSYTIETLFAAKNKNLKILQYSLSEYYRTRDSRLFSTNKEYLKKTLKILLSSILIYRRKIFFRIYILTILPGLFLIFRFINNYLKFDGYTGNVQSLLVGSAMITLTTIFYTMLVIISYMKKNMMEVEKSTYSGNYQIVKL